MYSKTYKGAIADAMKEVMEENENTMIIGQGVTDFKCIFGTIDGLHKRYPERVIETPLAEDSILGICIGASLNGIYPINTHIRADFAFLVLNQLINLAAKYKYMFGGLFNVPMMLRLIIGRSWGQGAQHSQSIQSILAHIPGLVVVMPTSPKSIVESYKYAVKNHKGPVVMLEHRLMYDFVYEDEERDSNITIFGSIKAREGNALTIVATSIMVIEAKRVANIYSRYNIEIEIIDMHSISHPNKHMIVESVRKTGLLLIADTSWKAYGVSAEVNRMINEEDNTLLKKPSISLGMADSPCPTAKALEDVFYPNIRTLAMAINELIGKEKTKNIPLPDNESTTKFYKTFKGPF